MVVNDRSFNMDVVIFRQIMTSKVGTKIVVTDVFARVHICQKCVCRAVPWTRWGSLKRSPRPLAEFGGCFEARRERRGVEGKGKGGKGVGVKRGEVDERGGERREGVHETVYSW